MKLLLILLSFQAHAGIFDTKNSAEHDKRSKELKQVLGELKCYEYAPKISICENKIHYCYKYSAYKKGSFGDCFLKTSIKE